MGIVLINQSAKIADADVEDIAAACDQQLQTDVAEAWGISDPLRVTTTPDATAYQFFLVDTIPEAPTALAYHSVRNGVPFGKIGIGPTLQAGQSVSSATSHEAVELQCDRFCASWSFSNRLQSLVATEACDPVQGEAYPITIPNGKQIMVCNFVTPAYFSDDALGKPVDHLGHLTRSFDITPGGYQVIMKGGVASNVFGPRVSAALRQGKEASQGRTFWRHVTMALAMS
jgi:hypothetical protein